MSERDLNNTVTPNPKLAVDYCGIKMKNPIIAASGTFGNGPEYAGYLDLSNEVGAISHFVTDILPDLKKYDVPLLANMSAGTVEEFAWMAETLSVDGIAGLEVNVSCPNVACEGMAFGIDPKVVEQVTKAVRKVTDKPVIVKLSPNVTDIVEIAKAVEAGGGDGVSLINTILGMAIDIHRRKPVLGNIYGGLSGPAVKPVALRMVHQVYKGVNIPIMGLGGIMTGTDAIEFMMAGAQAVQVGVATMVDPTAISRIAREMGDYVEQYNLNSITDIVGAVHQG
ncbi:MAG: dihydroorotate dehydrogenase [Veillonella sp.]|nr:dihydroorotate dehydrogenase [Veillonella sp.]